MVGILRVNDHVEPAGVAPEFAVVFYALQGRKDVVAATRHSIGSDRKLSLGRVVSAPALIKQIQKLGQANDAPANTILPPTVLVANTECLAWYAPRFIGDMWFRLGSEPKALRVEWPTLLYIADPAKRQLRVFALAKGSRPSAKTKVYHAPLMNINGEGELCLGTATLPANVAVDTISACEAAVVESQFTHVNHERTLKGRPENADHFAFWKSKAGSKKMPPSRVRASEMVSSGFTVADILGAQK